VVEEPALFREPASHRSRVSAHDVPPWLPRHARFCARSQEVALLTDDVPWVVRRLLTGGSRCKVPVTPSRQQFSVAATSSFWSGSLGKGEDVMRLRRLRISLFVTLTTLAGIVITVGASADAQTPKRGGTLRVSYGNEIAHLDFHTAPGYEMMWVAMNVGCGLVNITPDGKFVGDAADSWQVSSDGLLSTFRLRNNVLFHDGTKVDAAAVKFSIDRLMDPATKSGMRAFYESVHSVEVLDPLTVQIRLKHPYAFMLHMLA